MLSARRARLPAVGPLLAAGLTACEPSAPQASGALTLGPGDVHVVGTSESLADVRDLEVLEDGSVWVLNSLEPFFIGFRTDGTPLATHGQAGGGPEEFGLPSAFVTGGIEGAAWVLDLRRHALIEVSDPVRGRAVIPLPETSIPRGSVRGGMDVLSTSVRTARLGGEIVIPRTSATMDEGVFAFRLAILRADLVALDVRTGVVRDVVSLRRELDDPAAGFEPTEGGFPLWYRLWAVCGPDEIRVYDRARNAIGGFTSAGARLDPTPLPAPAFSEATPRQFARAVFPLMAAEAAGAVGARLTAADSTRVMNENLQRISGNPEQLSNYLPRYVDFRCAEDGTLWMQRFDLDIGRGGSTWLRIERDGASVEVRLPERFDAYRFTRERIWGVQRDQLDVASVAWIPIPGAS